MFFPKLPHITRGMVIPRDKVEIIKHCRKTLLYYEDSVWIKKGVGGNFDVSIGAYDDRKFANSSDVYYYITLIRLWTLIDMDCIETTG